MKVEKGVTILAHYYTTLDVQSVADYIGDSLALAQYAKSNIKTPYILFAAVKFMAETASILNQNKTVLFPDHTAGCPLANFLPAKTILEWKNRYPKTPIVVYVNTHAETKAYADVCCTSSNAVEIMKKVSKDWKTDTILFGPDRNLAHFVKKQTNLNIIPIPGNGICPQHDLFLVEDVTQARVAHPNALLLVHPESPPEVCDLADYVGSTAGIERYAASHESVGGYIIGTEIGMVDFLHHKYPQKEFFPLAKSARCPNMKKNTLSKILTTLQAIDSPSLTQYEVRVPKEIAEKAVISIDRMIKYSNQSNS